MAAKTIIDGLTTWTKDEQAGAEQRAEAESGDHGTYQHYAGQAAAFGRVLEQIDELKRGRQTALEVQADGRGATELTSDEMIRGNRQDIIATMRQDLQVLSEGRVIGYTRRMRVAEMVARAKRLKRLIDAEGA